MLVLSIGGGSWGLWWCSRKLKRLKTTQLDGLSSVQEDLFVRWKDSYTWFWRFLKSVFFGGPLFVIVAFFNALIFPPPKVHRSFNVEASQFEQSFEQGQTSPSPLLVIFFGYMVTVVIVTIVFYSKSSSDAAKLANRERRRLAELLKGGSVKPVPKDSPAGDLKSVDPFHEGLAGSPAAPAEEKKQPTIAQADTPEPTFNETIPADKQGAFLTAAGKLIKEGVNTPEKLVATLEKLGKGKMRPYTGAIWSLFRAADPKLPRVSDWGQYYPGSGPQSAVSGEDADLQEPKVGASSEDNAETPAQIAMRVLYEKSQPLFREVFTTALANPNMTPAEIADIHDTSEKAVINITRMMRTRLRILTKAAETEQGETLQPERDPETGKIKGGRPALAEKEKEQTTEITNSLNWKRRLNRQWKAIALISLVFLTVSAIDRWRSEAWESATTEEMAKERLVLVLGAGERSRISWNPITWVSPPAKSLWFTRERNAGQDTRKGDYLKVLLTEKRRGVDDQEAIWIVYGKNRMTYAKYRDADSRSYYRDGLFQYGRLHFSTTPDDNFHEALLKFLSVQGKQMD